MKVILINSFFILLFVFPALSQSSQFDCNKESLEKGVVYKNENPKQLVGKYKLTLVPTWSDTAQQATGRLFLSWEKRYQSIPADSILIESHAYPLVGYADGNFQKATFANFDERLNRTDPMNPGFKYDPKINTFMVPGQQPNSICTDCNFISFRIQKNLNGILIGNWIEDFGILAYKTSSGKLINEAVGTFCAEPI